MYTITAKTAMFDRKEFLAELNGATSLTAPKSESYSVLASVSRSSGPQAAPAVSEFLSQPQWAPVSLLNGSSTSTLPLQAQDISPNLGRPTAAFLDADVLTGTAHYPAENSGLNPDALINRAAPTATVASGTIAPALAPGATTRILQGLSATTAVFTGLENTFAKNSLLSGDVSVLGERLDATHAKAFVGEIKNSLEQGIGGLKSLPNLNLQTIVDEVSSKIKTFGTVAVNVDGKLIAPALLGGVNLKPDSEVMFNFDFAKSISLTRNLSGTKTFSLAGTNTNIAMTGKANGSATLSLTFKLGIDKLGKIFTSENGQLISKVDLNAAMTGKASIKGLANGEIDGSGKVSLNTSVKIDDGDTIANERLYLSGSTGTLFAAKGISFSGGIDLDRTTIKGSISNLPGFDIPVAATTSLDFVTGKAEIKVQQDAILDALVNAAEKGIRSLTNQSNKVAEFTKRLPFVGSSLSTVLTSTLAKGFDFDAPTAGTRSYLASRNINVEKVITPQQFFSGTFLANDALLLHYRPLISDTLQWASTPERFDAGIASFTLNGNLQTKPNLALDLKFGLDLVNGPFLYEGGTINAQLPIKGALNGSATIGKFLSGQVKIDNANYSSTARLTFSDFDGLANERFYLLGNTNTLSIDNILQRKEAISLAGNFALDAALVVTSNEQNVKIPILNRLNFGSLNWNATLRGDLATGKANYSIKNDAKIAAMITLLQGRQADIINLFLENLVKANPIPKEVRTTLTEKIPLLDRSLLDIIGAPKGIQLLINPDQFRGRTLQQINDKSSQEGLDVMDLSLDVLKSDTILRLLGGQENINLISLDVKQTLPTFEKKFTVLPSTTIFSLYGIAGISAGVDLEAAISMLLDTTMGFDTQGFYVIESGAKAPSGRTVGNTLFSLNPSVTGILKGTLDLITVLDLIDIAGRISLLGKLGLRLDDGPLGVDSDPKVRLSGLNDANLKTTTAIDLGLGLTSTLLPISNFGLPLIKKGEVEKIVPLYNKSSGSLADLKNDIKSFIDTTKGEGGLKTFALGTVTGSPALKIAGISLIGSSPKVTEAFRELANGLKDNDRDMMGAAKDLARLSSTYGLKLGETAKFLYENFTGGVNDLAKALYEGVSKNLPDIFNAIAFGAGRGVANGIRGLVGANLLENNSFKVATFLLSSAGVGLGATASGIRDWLGTSSILPSFNAIAYGAKRGVVDGVRGLVGANLLENSSYKVATFLLSSAGLGLGNTATAIKDWLGTSSILPSFNAIAYGAKRGVVDGIRGLVGANYLENDSYKVAIFLLSSAGVGLGTTASAIKDWLGSSSILPSFNAIAYGAKRGVVDGVRGLVGANYLENDSYKVATFLLSSAGVGLGTTASAIKDWLGTSSILPSFKAIAYGAKRGVVDGIRGLIGASFLENDSFKVATFLLSSAGVGLGTTASAIKDWLGTSSILPSFNAITYGAKRGVADGIRGLVGANLLENSSYKVATFLLSTAGVGLGTTASAIKDWLDTTSIVPSFNAIAYGANKGFTNATRGLLSAGLLANNFGSIKAFLLSQLSAAQALIVLQELGFKVGSSLSTTVIKAGDTLADIFGW